MRPRQPSAPYLATLAGFFVWGVGCEAAPTTQKGTLRLRTDPPGAALHIAGTAQGRTPATLLLEAGTYTVTLQAEGARAIETTVDIRAGEAAEKNINLPKPPPAQVTVLADRDGMDVRINGYRRGSTPLLDAHTRPGPIDVTVTSKDGAARAVRTTLRVGEDKLIQVQFDDHGCKPSRESASGCPLRQHGWLTLGVDRDATVTTESGTRLGRTPLTRRRMAAGPHKLRLRSQDGGFEKWVDVVVEGGEHHTFRLRFDPKRDQTGTSTPAPSKN